MDRPTDPKERFFIAPEPGETTSLKDSFLVAIRYRSVVYKIFKLVFRSRTADLYFTFPYLSGFATFQQWRSLRPGEIGDQITPVPSEVWRLRAPKLSYHESGVVHFKSFADADEMTHVRTVCTPIRLLAGEIF